MQGAENVERAALRTGREQGGPGAGFADTTATRSQIESSQGVPEMIEYALARGWAIFPTHHIEDGRCSCGKPDCDSPGKHPRIPNGVKGASRDPQQIAAWAAQSPGCNWSVATGAASGVWVLDIDAHKADGRASLDAWLSERGLTLPETLVVATGGGGWHYYFDAARAVRNRTNVLPGVDVRGDGGYVLLPGSNHLSGGLYSVAREAEVRSAPEMLVDLIAAPPLPPAATGSGGGSLLDPVPEGERNDTLFRMACGLRRSLKDNREAVDLLVRERGRRSGLSDREIDTIIESAFAQDHRDPWDYTQVPFSEGDADPFVDVAALLAGDLAVPEPDTGSRRTDGLPLLYSGKVNALYGDPEAGKTLIAMCMAADILADGGSALFIDIDHNGAAITLSRLLSLGVDPGVLGDRARFRLAEPEDMDSYLRVMAQGIGWRPALVMIDSVGELMPMFGLNSNSSDDYAILNRRAIQPFAQDGTAVLVVDHYPKDPGNRRGPGGTMRKTAALSGVGYEVQNQSPFDRAHGGRAALFIAKDRPGGIRARCEPGKRVKAATLVIAPAGLGIEHSTWTFYAPDAVPLTNPFVSPATVEVDSESDVQALMNLSPAPRSKRDVMARLGWGDKRAQEALRGYRDMTA